MLIVDKSLRRTQRISQNKTVKTLPVLSIAIQHSTLNELRKDELWAKIHEKSTC